MKLLHSVVLLAVVGFIANIIYRANVFYTVHNHSKFTCSKVRGVVGSEDMEIDITTGLAFISSGNLTHSQATGGNYEKVDNGKILVADLTDEGSTYTALTIKNFPHVFLPHGLSLYRVNSQRLLLFVINHRSEQDVVEVFEYSHADKTLMHIKSYSDDNLMHNPNDVVAVGENKFYVTNDHYFKAKWLQMVEDFLSLPLSYILYYDGDAKTPHFETAVRWMRFVNGVAVSKDGNYIYATGTLDKAVHVFKRDLKTGHLSKVHSIHTLSAVDNIYVEPTSGDLWIGCTIKPLAFIAHAKDNSVRSPTQVIRIRNPNRPDYKIDDVLQDDGHLISGGSTAVYYPKSKTMLVGAVFEKWFLRCKLADRLD